MGKDAQVPEIRAAVVCPACAFPAPVPTGVSVAVCACGTVIRVPAVPTWPPIPQLDPREGDN